MRKHFWLWLSGVLSVLCWWFERRAAAAWRRGQVPHETLLGSQIEQDEPMTVNTGNYTATPLENEKGVTWDEVRG